MDSYTWTYQCWLTSKKLHPSTLSTHWMQSRKLNESDDLKRWMEKKKIPLTDNDDDDK